MYRAPKTQGAPEKEEIMKERTPIHLKPHCTVKTRTCYCDWSTCEIRNGQTIQIHKTDTSEKTDYGAAISQKDVNNGFEGALKKVVASLGR
jgi:hypothetical protein